MFRRRRKSPGRSDLTAFIDEGSQIEGRYTGSGVLMLNGTFKGEIASTDTLIVGDKAVITADIRAGQALISGEVVGNVRATERVELRRPARVFGDIDAPILVMEEGALFEGHCRMTKAGQVAEPLAARDGSEPVNESGDRGAPRLCRGASEGLGAVGGHVGAPHSVVPLKR